MPTGTCTIANKLEVHPSDCNKYIMCDSNKIPIAVYECPKALTFNSVTGVCDDNFNKNCGLADVSESITTSEQVSRTTTAEGNSHLF